MHTLPIRYLVTLAAVFDGVLYVVQPPNINSGYIQFDQYNGSWHRMDNDYIDGIKVLKKSIKNISVSDNILPFKIKFFHRNYSVETQWQNVVVVDNAVKIKKKCEPDNTNWIVNIILSVTLFTIVLIPLSIYAFVYCNK